MVCLRLGRPVRLIMAMFSITKVVSVTMPTWTLSVCGIVHVLVDWPSQWPKATLSFQAIQLSNSQYPSKLAATLGCYPTYKLQLSGFLSFEVKFIWDEPILDLEAREAHKLQPIRTDTSIFGFGRWGSTEILSVWWVSPNLETPSPWSLGPC